MSAERYYRSQSLNAQWVDLSQSIGQLLVEHEGSDATKPEARAQRERHDITTKHWADSDCRTNCVATECVKKFTVTERKHHCRRCGEVFCGKCSQYRRRLSVLATPDSEGIPYRVCKKCFDVGPQTLGSVRSCFEDFKHFKERKKSGNNNEKQRRIPRKFLNYEDECQRLVDGFRNKVGSSKIMSFVMETFGAVKVPDWQKSKYWVEKSEQCLLCYKKFPIAELKSHCRVCGKVVCSSCSSETLIVYVEGANKVVSWCLINIIGSPEKEPAVCLYLRLCNHCHGEVAEIQGKKVIAEQTEIDGPSLVDEMANINESLATIQGNIIKHLPMYEQLVDAVEAKGDLKGLIPQGGSATQALAKYHSDLSDFFTKFAVVMQSLKRLKPKTNTQIKLAKNMTSSKFSFYSDNFPVYRESKKRLEEVLPLEILEGVQKIVDEQAINSAYIVIKQLGLEALLLTSGQHIDNQIATLLVSCEDICKDELQKQLETSKSDWNEHNKTIQELLQVRLKKHRLVKPSTRLTKAHGAKYVEWFLLDRSDLLLSQIIRQLNGKTAEKKFKTSKNVLQAVKLQVIELRDQK